MCNRKFQLMDFSKIKDISYYYMVTRVFHDCRLIRLIQHNKTSYTRQIAHVAVNTVSVIV